MPDHVHLFIETDPTLAPAHIANQFKGFTSRILRQEFRHLRSRMPALWSQLVLRPAAVGYVSEAYRETLHRRPKDTGQVDAPNSLP